ncbi:hypothetical protein [Thermogemmatispora carboxidivorans]|nr:hypothetical protein [Thermogemmatispora carboxidivorans]
MISSACERSFARKGRKGSSDLAAVYLPQYGMLSSALGREIQL